MFLNKTFFFFFTNTNFVSENVSRYPNVGIETNVRCQLCGFVEGTSTGIGFMCTVCSHLLL